MHRERYGYAIEGETIELVSFKVTAVGRRPRSSWLTRQTSGCAPSAGREVYFAGEGRLASGVVDRAALEPEVTHTGPPLIQEDGSTTLVPPGFRARSPRSGAGQ